MVVKAEENQNGTGCPVSQYARVRRERAWGGEKANWLLARSWAGNAMKQEC